MKSRGLFLFFSLMLAAPSVKPQSVWNPERLSEVKARIESPYYSKSYESLIRRADAMLDAEPLSVMMKDKTPPQRRQT